MNLARSAQVNFKTQIQEWKNILLRGHNQASYEKYLKGFTEQEAATQKDLSDLVKSLEANGLDSKSSKASLETHLDLGQKYRKALEEFKVEDPKTTALVDSLVKGMDRPASKAIDELVGAINSNAATTSVTFEKKIVRQSKIFKATLLVIVLLSVCISLVLGFILSRSVTRLIDQTVLRLHTRTETMNDSSKVLDSSSLLLAEGASKQAASIESISSALEEMTQLIKQNAETAQLAKQAVNQAKMFQEINASEIKQMSQSMEDLKESSEKITKIAKTINNVAFRTNMLSLNATIEAARAGEYGIGFSVVAEEVRSLSKKCAVAAKETTQIVNESLIKTKLGVEASEKMLSVYTELTSQIAILDSMIAQLAQATNEHSEEIFTINQSVSQITVEVQSTSSTTERLAVSSKSLTGEVANFRSELSSLLSHTKVSS